MLIMFMIIFMDCNIQRLRGSVLYKSTLHYVTLERSL